MTIKILKKNQKKLKAKLWRLFSEYIRRKDANLDGYNVCCTCGKVAHYKELQAGHYYHDKSLPLHFCESNVHPQCVKCNYFKDGNRDEYALFLEKTYGMGILQELKALDKPLAQGHFWIAEKIEEYKKKLAEIPYLHGSYPGHNGLQVQENRRSL